MATPTTLPATFVSGAVLTAAQQNDLRGAFRVLQVVSTVTGTTVDSSSTSFAPTTLAATITPTATSSKILVLITHPSCYKSVGNTANGLNMELHRDIGGGGFSNILSIGRQIGFTGTALELLFAMVGSHMDSPASVAAITYRTMFANNVAANLVRVQLGSFNSQITLMEISA